jgi:protein arginine N-methyltransferase 7
MSNEKNLTVNQIFDLAVQNHQNNNLQDAQNYYQKVLELDPNYANPHNNLGVIFQELGKNQKAKDCFEKAIKINPNYADAHNNLGVIFQGLGEYQKAKDCYKKAIEINPNYSGAHNNLGVIFQGLGENQKVKDCYEKAIKINPNYADAHYNLGNIFNDLKEYQKAKDCYEKVIKINPNYSGAHNNLGIIFKELRDDQKAIGCFEKAIEINPNYAIAYNNLGTIFKELKKFDEAEISLKKAIELKPDYAEAYNNLGVVLHNLGRFSEAIDKYKQAIKLKPNYVKARINLNASTSLHVFPWHLQMMNDKFRNDKYLEAIKLAIEDVDDNSLILDIGTGSGLLSMMAAANSTGEVIACEASSVIADTAKKIIHKNGYKEKITVINKKSTELKIGEDLPRKADLIISEILSAEFVGEGVRTSIFDANKRLLKKNGKMIPESGTIKISLLGNDKEIFNTISVANVSGFDLSEFNSISPSKFVHFLKKKPTLLSNNEDAFNINLYNEENIVKEEKIIELKVNKEGLCLGIIQWMKIHLYKDIEYENSPNGYLDSSSHWPTPIYLFDKPISVKKGDVLKIRASLDRDNLWFFKE